jgi:VWFA-related protein
MANFMEIRENISTNGTLAAIRFVLDGLRDLPSRKYLVLFSENLQIFNRQPDASVEAMVQHLIDAANRASVVLYSVDPRGLQVHGLTAADDARYSSPQQVAGLPMERSAAEFHSRDGLVALAAGTGGLFLRNRNDLDDAVRQVIRDTDGYYLIGYHPDSNTFDPKTGRAKFHKVTVRVKRAGLQVRSRGGFYGAPDRELQAAPSGRDSEILHALRSPFSASGIHVRLTPLFSNSEKSRT